MMRSGFCLELAARVEQKRLVRRHVIEHGREEIRRAAAARMVSGRKPVISRKRVRRSSSCGKCSKCAQGDRFSLLDSDFPV